MANEDSDDDYFSDESVDRLELREEIEEVNTDGGFVLRAKIYGAWIAVLGVSGLLVYLNISLFLKSFGLLLLSIPLLLFSPQAIGYIVSQAVVNFGTFGYPFYIKHLWVLPYLTKTSLHLQVNARDVGFENPPNFPYKHFLHVDRLNMELSITFKEIINAIKMKPAKVTLKKSGPMDCYFIIDVAYIDLEGIMINFQLYRGRFNINEFVKLIADNEVKANLGPVYPWPINTLPGYNLSGYWNEKFPNKLSVRVIRARNLPIADRSGSSDPYAVVRCREQKFTTETRVKTLDPVFDAAHDFVVTDASTVLHVVLMDQDIGSRDDFLGQWVMTVKYFVTDPYYNHHTEMSVSRNGTVKGWFPLMSKDWQKKGELGEVELEMRWSYEEGFGSDYVPKAQSALDQLTENSNESKLRFGNMTRVKKMLNHVPILFKFNRVSIRHVQFYLKDLFRGKKGEAEKLQDKNKDPAKSKHISVKHIDWKKQFKPRKGDPGIPVAAVVERFFMGLAYQVNDVNLVGSAVGQIFSGLFFNARDAINFKKLVPLKRQGKNNAKEGGKKILSKGKRASMPYDKIESSDPYFETATECEGLLQVKMGPKKKFKTYQFELKGPVLYFRKREGGVIQRIDLENVIDLTHDKNEETLVLQEEADGGREATFRVPDDEGKQTGLSKWFEKMKGLVQNSHTIQFELARDTRRV